MFSSCDAGNLFKDELNDIKYCLSSRQDILTIYFTKRSASCFFKLEAVNT